jgi:hypothetical protein
MHKMHKRNENLKNSCEWTQKVATLRKKREWKSCGLIKYKHNTIKAKKSPKNLKH